MTLWCMNIPGPDDIFAAPDRSTAEKWAAEHNAWLDQQFWEGRIEFDGYWPNRSAMTAVVIEWPWSAEAHANNLKTNVFATKPP